MSQYKKILGLKMKIAEENKPKDKRLHLPHASIVVVAGTLQSLRAKSRKRFIIGNWLALLWRLQSPGSAIYKLETQERWYYSSVRVQVQQNIHLWEQQFYFLISH